MKHKEQCHMTALHQITGMFLNCSKIIAWLCKKIIQWMILFHIAAESHCHFNIFGIWSPFVLCDLHLEFKLDNSAKPSRSKRTFFSLFARKLRKVIKHILPPKRIKTVVNENNLWKMLFLGFLRLEPWMRSCRYFLVVDSGWELIKIVSKLSPCQINNAARVHVKLNFDYVVAAFAIVLYRFLKYQTQVLLLLF